jgi:hypothetical protein
MSVDLRPHPPHHSGMDRRRFLVTSLAVALAAPLAAGAQEGEGVPDRLSDQWLRGHVGAPEFRFAQADSAVDLESVTSAALLLPCPTPLLEGDGAMVDDAPPGHARSLGVGKARQ